MKLRSIGIKKVEKEIGHIRPRDVVIPFQIQKLSVILGSLGNLVPNLN
jgi:hypothetical protein